jgi:hypothetical protein
MARMAIPSGMLPGRQLLMDVQAKAAKDERLGKKLE